MFDGRISNKHFNLVLALHRSVFCSASASQAGQRLLVIDSVLLMNVISLFLCYIHLKFQTPNFRCCAKMQSPVNKGLPVTR